MALDIHKLDHLRWMLLFPMLLITSMGLSFSASAAEGIRKSCEVLDDGRSSPEVMRSVCDCIARTTGLTDYDGFGRLNDALRQHSELQKVADTFVQSPEDFKVFKASLDCSLGLVEQEGTLKIRGAGKTEQ